MRRKALRLAFFGMLTILALIVITAGAFFWRLSQAPVSLAFLNNSIERAVNRQLPGYKIVLGEVVLELDSESGIPLIHTRNLVLKDADGAVIASAPKAGVGVNGMGLLLGNLTVRSLELIGPRIDARRNLDGSVELGIGEVAASPDEEIVVNESEVAQDTTGATKLPPAGGRILDLLGVRGGDGALANLEDIRVTRASLRLYDESNDATWMAPRADLTFRKMPYGFIVVAKADVASGGDPWHAEISASFRNETRNYAINATVTDLVPANVADEIFALSQFARLKMPFSGHFELDVTETGVLTQASGELFASAGEISLPDYLAKPILVDEGALRISYASSEDVVRIIESSILAGGSRAEIQGSIVPRRSQEGKLTALGFDLSAKNVSVDAQGTIRDPVTVDKVEFKGEASVDDPRVQIDDLVVMAGNTGVRLRGVISGGDESAGIQLAGRLRDVSAGLLKKLWPPILAPRTRGWINDNVVDGRVTQGTFQVNFPVNTLARALRDRKLPSNVVDLSFAMDDVSTRYFKNLPLLTDAAGRASLRDDQFELSIDKGQASLANGKTLTLAKGSFSAHDLLLKEVPGKFAFDIQGPVDSMTEFAALPDLNLMATGMKNVPQMTGQARALVGLEFPMIKNVPRDRVRITTNVSVTDAGVPGVMPGIDISEGRFAISIDPDTITVSGPAKVNGISSQINWQKPRGPGAATAEIETTLDAKMRDKLGLKLADYMSGDVPVKVRFEGEANESRKIMVRADLSAVDMKLAAAGWSRPATKGTKATFTIIGLGNGKRKVNDLKLDGPGLHLRGTVELLQGGGVGAIDLGEIRLNEDDIFTASLVPGDKVMNLTITGKSIDARPYIKSIISPAKGSETAGQAPKGQNFVVDAHFDRVIAHRGEIIHDVRATFVTHRGSMTSANIEGRYGNGLPITVRLTPKSGARELRVTSSDGGSTLRATNFYSKVAGGEMTFYALIANAPGSPIQNGQLVLRRFEVRNEAALAELDQRGKPKKSGPRNVGVAFKKLELPFTTDAKFVRICGVELKGNDLGAVAGGIIRKSDGAIDITGTMIPAQGLNNLLGNVPLVGQILSGGSGEGIIGITFAMGGTISNPSTQVNPVSALLPGFLRKLSEFQGSCGRRNVPPVGTKETN